MILIVDDDSSVTASLSLALKQAGYRSRLVATPGEALNELEREPYELVIQDMNFSRNTTGEEGLNLLKKIKGAYPEIPVILITAWGSIPLAVSGMRAGASDFITKPWNNVHLVQSVRAVLGAAALRSARQRQPVPSREELDKQYDFHGIIGQSPRLLEVLDVVGCIASTDASVLITGESGTGKELIAEAIHQNSNRRHNAFVKVNLGGISSTLFESEMFGHVKGAFTDALHDRSGRFEKANGGTIFLDEVGDLDPGSQVKLLRVLQDRTYEVLGSSHTRRVDVRVVSATNRPLPDLISRGEFREDLYYRLNLITVHLPALRERRGDIPLLAQHFLRMAGQAHGLTRRTLSDQAVQWLRAQPWPGNVRQLRHLVERALLVSRQSVLDVPDFAGSATIAVQESKYHDLPDVGTLTIDEIEKAMIEKTMAHFEGNISRVADALGLSRAALYRRFEKYGIQP